MKVKLYAFLCLMILVLGSCTPNSIVPNPTPIGTIEPTATEKKVTLTTSFPTATEQLLQTPTSEVNIPTPLPEPELQIVNVIPESQIGGSSEALAVSDQYAYLGVGPRLIVLNVAISDNPQVLGQSDLLPGVVTGVVVKDDYAYVITKTGYFGIISLSDPIKPQLISSLELQILATGITVVDHYVYLAGGTAGILTIDVSNKETPSQALVTSTLYDALAIAIHNNFAYVAERNPADINGALQVFDVSDPESPQVVGILELTYFAQAITISNSYAYLASNGLVVVDISEPGSPQQVGVYEEIEFYNDVAVADNYAFISTNQYCDVVSVCPRQISMIDVRDPSHPQPPNIPITGNSWAELSLGRVLIVRNGFVYMATESGLRVFDASTLAQVGQYKPVGSVDDIAMLKGVGYTVDGHNSLHIIGMDDSANLTNLGTYQCVECAALDRVIIANGFAYLGSWDSGFTVVDVQSVQQPLFVTRYEIPGGNILLVADESYLYVIPDTTIFDPTTPPCLYLFDVQNPAEPLEVSSLQLSGVHYSKITLNNGLAYLGSTGRLEVVDVSNPAIPKLVTNYSIATDPANYRWSLAVNGKYAYFVRQALAEPFQVELITLDITALAEPQQIAFMPLTHGGSDVAVAGDYLYVLGFDGLSVVDVSVPTQPREIGSAKFGGKKIQAEGNYLYIAGGESGLLILQINQNQ